MKFALITGPNGFELVQEMNLGYHLVLAQHCLSSSEYLNFYIELQRKGHFIILDNGAAEMQHSIDFDSVLEVADVLNPDEIVMPDELGNYTETIDQFSRYRPSVPWRKRMGVPQGENWAQWEQCLIEMLDAGVHSIGVAKRYEGFDGGRARALQMLKPDVVTHVPVHLLGCYKKPFEEVRNIADLHYWVRGVDTAAPLAHAQQRYSMYDQIGHVSYEWDEPFPHGLAKNNVEEMLRACAHHS